MGWIYLLAAGLFEIGFAVSLKQMDGHRNIPWTLGFYFSIICSFTCLNLALRYIPIGTAYAVWTGIGAAGTAMCGILFLGESASFLRIFFLSLLILSVFGLKLSSES
jgi:quaternary ammonium compound-resistance protein SugE